MTVALEVKFYLKDTTSTRTVILYSMVMVVLDPNPVKKGFQCILFANGTIKYRMSADSYFSSTFAAPVGAAKSSSDLRGRRQTAQTRSRGKKCQTWRIPGKEEWADYKHKAHLLQRL